MLTFVLANTLPSLMPYLTLAVTVIIQVAGFVWMLSRMHSRVERVGEEIGNIKTLPDRVSKLEWEVTQNKVTLGEMREIIHKINSKLHEIALSLQSLKEWADQQRDENGGK